MTEIVPHAIRLVESDSLGANKKAERMMQASHKWRGWTHLSWYCMAHRVHQALTRSLSFYKPLSSGLTQTALLMCHTPGNLPKARRLLTALVEEKFAFVRGQSQLDLASVRFKQRCIQLFAPVHAMPFLVFVSTFVLNADWRNGDQITHFCQGCCASRADALMKTQQALLKILSLVPPRLLSKANWLEWRKGAQFMGVMGSVHRVGRELVQRLLGVTHNHRDIVQGVLPQDRADPDGQAGAAAPGGAPAEPRAAHVIPAHQDGEVEDVNVVGVGEQALPQEALVAEMRNENVQRMPEARPAQDGLLQDHGELDELAALRRLEEQRRSDVMTFLQVPMMWDMLVVMMQCLKPEIHLMQKTLHLAGAKWAMKEMVKMHQSGARDYSLQLLSSEAFYDRFMSTSMRMLRGPETWDHLVPSEMLATKVILSTLRMVTVIFELCILAARRFPERLFRLVGAEEEVRAAIALGIVEAPNCVKDTWTLWFLGLYPSVEALQSADSVAMLTAVMHMSDGHTLSTERAHSRNLRHAKSRIQTHKVDVAWLAATHQHSATPPWAMDLQTTARPRAAEPKPRARKRKRRQEQDVLPRHHGANHVQDAQLQPVRACEGHQDHREGQEARRLKRPGAGGAWRAYLHATGQQASAAAARDYRSLDEESRAFYLQLGREGTAAARAGIMGFGGVGAGAQRPRGAEEAQQDRENNAFLFKPLPHNDMLFTTALCMRQKRDVETLRQLIRQGRHNHEAVQSEEEEHFQQLQHMLHVFGDSFRSPPEPYPLKVLCQLSSSWKKARTKELRSRDGDAAGGMMSDKEKLIAYNEQTLPGLRAFHPHMTGVTHISFPSFCPAVSACMSCSSSPPQSNYQTFSDAWVERHSGVLASSVAERFAGGNYKAKPQSACWRAGRCMCHGAGRLQRIMASKIDMQLKQFFPRGPDRHEKLVGGLVVLSLSVSGDEAAEGEAPVHIYAHVSLMYLSPWRATLTLLDKKDQDTFTVQCDPNGWPACRTVFDLVSAMRADKAWSMQVLLVDPHRDSTIEPQDYCTLRAVAWEKPAEVVWRGERAERRQPQVAAAAGWDFDLDEPQAQQDDDNGSEGEEVESLGHPLTPENSGTGCCVCKLLHVTPERRKQKQETSLNYISSLTQVRVVSKVSM